MDLQTVERMVDELLGQLETGDLDSETAGRTLATIYTGLIEKYRPLLKGLPELAPVVSNDIVPLIELTLSICCALSEDPAVNGLRDRYVQAKAANRMRELKIYTGVGFDREEAMAFILQDIANSQSKTQAMSRHVTTARASQKRSKE